MSLFMAPPGRQHRRVAHDLPQPSPCLMPPNGIGPSSVLACRECAKSLAMGNSIQSLIIFVLILVGLNFFLSEFDYGVHISIVGSIVLTLVISLIMGSMSGRR